MTKPNIFEIATKELSQDAFLTWLLRHADPSVKKYDENLHLAGTALLSKILSFRKEQDQVTIQKVEAGMQWKGIDIRASVNDRYGIIIEDKVHTNDHSDQLERYKQIAQEWCEEEGYAQPICVFLKTENETLDNERRIAAKGYFLVSRKDLIDVLSPFEECSNDLLRDYVSNLKRIEELYNAWQHTPVTEWKNHRTWLGLYRELEKKNVVMKWHYVPNPSGGFWNALVRWTDDAPPFYLQIEEELLCFKLCTDEKETGIAGLSDSGLKNRLAQNLWQNAALPESLPVRKPGWIRTGTYLTVGMIDPEHWLARPGECVNPDFVVKNIEACISVLENYKSDLNEKSI